LEGIVNGYIIATGFSGESGKIKCFLDRNRRWHSKVPVEAYVFSPEETKQILKTAEDKPLDPMPEYIIPAEYVQKTDSTKVVGPIQPAYSVNPTNVE